MVKTPCYVVQQFSSFFPHITSYITIQLSSSYLHDNSILPHPASESPPLSSNPPSNPQPPNYSSPKSKSPFTPLPLSPFPPNFSPPIQPPIPTPSTPNPEVDRSSRPPSLRAGSASRPRRSRLRLRILGRGFWMCRRKGRKEGVV
jgi:hypothetical protein